MNKYIVLGVVLFLTGSYASENPFSVNKHFQQLDQEENSLLSELKAVSIKLEEAEDAADEDDDDEDEEELPQKEAVVVSVPAISDKNDTASTEVAVKAEEAKLAKVKEDQLRLEEARAKQEKEKLALEKLASETLATEKIAMKKAEAEATTKKVEEKRIAEEVKKLEVEKAKLEKKLSEEKAARMQVDAEKSAVAVEKSELKETTPLSPNAKKEESEAMNEVDSGRKSTPTPSIEKKPSVETVKPTVLKDPEAKQMADEAYKEALREVDKED